MHAGLFGGNILIHRNQIGDDGTYDELAEALGITAIRYPGGSVTEFYFDISDPDRAVATHPNTGEEQTLIPYSNFMSYAAAEGVNGGAILDHGSGGKVRSRAA